MTGDADLLAMEAVSRRDANALGSLGCGPLLGHDSFKVRRRPPQALHDVAQVHRFTVPGRHRLLAGDQDARILQVFDQLSGGVGADGRWRRAPFKQSTARIEEPHPALVIHTHAEASFMEQAVVSAAEQHEVREFRFAAVGPVLDVVRVAVL